ncbi:hypothetical protein SAY86_008680 [Trapa natans]|uniref:Uncharacterized protein n=1 Tax=Trapa natans TaxID=22666 RepID=A0AAN7KAL6_TRANT|nr:hypothetical protein SAY86_008680 [Trapa natans]
MKLIVCLPCSVMLINLEERRFVATEVLGDWQFGSTTSKATFAQSSQLTVILGPTIWQYWTYTMPFSRGFVLPNLLVIYNMTVSVYFGRFIQKEVGYALVYQLKQISEWPYLAKISYSKVHTASHARLELHLLLLLLLSVVELNGTFDVSRDEPATFCRSTREQMANPSLFACIGQ